MTLVQVVTLVSVTVSACAGVDGPSGLRSTTTTNLVSSTTTTAPLLLPVTPTSELPRSCPPPIRGDDGWTQERLFASGPSLVTIRYDEGVSEAALTPICEAIPLAQLDMGDSGPLTVHVLSTVDAYLKAQGIQSDAGRKQVGESLTNGLAYQATTRGIWVYTPNQARSRNGNVRTSLYHEYFHTVQRFHLGKEPSGMVPVWLIEGSAEYFGTVAAGVRGYYDFQAARLNIVRRVKQQSTPTLSALESRVRTTFQTASADDYNLGFIATEFLAKRYGEKRIVRDFWVALSLRDWQSAFTETFGTSLPAFYEEFESYLAAL